MHRGYVKDYRKSLDHPLYKRPLVWHFWGYCLKRANHQDKEIDFDGKPFMIKRGNFIMSIQDAVDETGLTRQNIRTAVQILENHKMIEKSTKLLTQQAHHITICKYDIYQAKEKVTNQVTNQPPTNHQPSANQVLTINNNDKNVNNDKEEKIPIVKKAKTEKHYPKQFLKLWVDHPNASGSKSQTYKNYNKTKSLFLWSDEQIYQAAMNLVKKQKDESKTEDVYYYQLSNVVGEKYRDDLRDVLNYEEPKTKEKNELLKRLSNG